MIILVELQDGETIKTIRKAIKNNTLDNMYIHKYKKGKPLDIVRSYVMYQEFEIETNHPILYLIFPDNEIKGYNYKILDYSNGSYLIKEVNL